MRILLMTALLASLTLAGCVNASDVDSPPASLVGDACELGICLAGDHLEEADFQPNAAPLLSFHEDSVQSVNNVVRTDSGWAFTLRDADDRWSLVWVDESSHDARQVFLPAGSTPTPFSLLRSGDSLLLTIGAGADRLVSMVRWNLATDALQVTDLQELPHDARPRSEWDGTTLLVAQRGLLTGDSAAWLVTDGEVTPVLSTGRVMDATMATGLLYLAVEEEAEWRVEMRSPDGTFVRNAWVNDRSGNIAAIYGRDDHVAFQVTRDGDGSGGGQLYEVDHLTHEVRKMGNGWDVKFAGADIYHLTAYEESSPFVSQWSHSLQAGSEGVFLPDLPLWDVSEEGLWWLEAPRTDHRYRETPNPTPFTTMLMVTER